MAESIDIPLLPSHIVTERTHVVIPSLPNWIEPTVEYLRQRAVLGGICQETRSGKLLIALHEAISNAIIHGNLELSSDLKEQGDNAFAEALAQRAADPILANRKVDIVVDFDGEAYRWVVTDQGRGFDVEKVLARCLSDDPELMLASGRGILMMKSFLDDVRFEMGGRRVVMALLRDTIEERRQTRRLPWTASYQVTPMLPDGTPDWASTYEATSRNFSDHGMSLVQHDLAYSGKILIGIPTDKGIVHIPARVKHSRTVGANGMELGCEFEAPLPSGNPLPAPAPIASTQIQEVHEAVEDILHAFQAKLPTHERRVHPRVAFTEQVTVVLDQRREPMLCYARDLSKRGISFLSQERLAAEITILFTPAVGRPALTVRCKVVRCNRVEDGLYDIGAAFLRMETEA